MGRKISLTLSGVEDISGYRDAQLLCNYVYISSDSLHKAVGKEPYSKFTSDYRGEAPVAMNFVTDDRLGLTGEEGAVCLTTSEEPFSVFRREYQVFEKNIRNPNSGDFTTVQQVFQGQWEPVSINTTRSLFRDFNIVVGKSYQYIMYPNSASEEQQFANYTEVGTYAKTGVPIEAKWNEWSLAELIPVENSIDAPILRKTYEVDMNNIWLFKYALETGAQNQNFQKSEIQTLGQYQRMGYGKMNFISGDVSCLLGSEIVPYSPYDYIERMRSSIQAPLSTNEKAFMLEQWRKIASSPNPKLLKDMKGQSWIVQIVSSNNTPKNFYANQPDTISFSWRQIDDTKNVIILGEGNVLPTTGESIWVKV